MVFGTGEIAWPSGGGGALGLKKTLGDPPPLWHVMSPSQNDEATQESREELYLR